jgi:ketosteroid isomerase-like protein
MQRTLLLTSLVWLAALPAAARAGAPGAAVIAEQETLFARAVETQGVRAGFLAYLAETAVVFNPEPVAARHSYESKPEDGARLRWRPDLAAISEDGEFGWASGPWLYWSPASTGPAEAAGHYLTVWRHAGGSWKVLLDAGISYPNLAADRPRALEVEARLRPTAKPHTVSTGCDEALAGRWKDRGRATALADYGADDLRLLQFGQPPHDGLEVARAADNLRGSTLRSLRVARRLDSARGDISVSYGEYELYAEGANATRRAGFVAVWDSGKHCRLALELTQPLG